MIRSPAGAAADDISVVDESTLKELSAKSGCNDAWTLDQASIWQVGLYSENYGFMVDMCNRDIYIFTCIYNYIYI